MTDESENGREPQDFEVACEYEGERMDIFLSSVGELSRSRLKGVIEGGFVSVNGNVELRPRHLVHTGDRVVVQLPPPEPATPIAQDIPLNIVFEDSELIVIDKPAGMVVHPGAGTPDGTLVNALLGRGEGRLSEIGGVQRPGIVHRLDKDTSGLLVVARNDTAHRYLSAALARREIKRIYHTIVLRQMPAVSGSVNLPIGRHQNQRTKMAIVEVERGGREALTYWRVLEHFHGFALVECRLATGRTHQIRVHMSQIKHPVLGDELYGGSIGTALQLVPGNQPVLQGLIRKWATRQMLHARYLSFVHPVTGEMLEFESPLPRDFSLLLEEMRKIK